MFKPEPMPEVPPELAPAFNEIAARADAAQRLAITAIEMLAQEIRNSGRRWNLVLEADRIEGQAEFADGVGSRGRVIAAALLRTVQDSMDTGRLPGR